MFLDGEDHHSDNAEIVAEHVEGDAESDVDYPLIDLKTGLKNEIIDRTLKDLKKAAKRSDKENKSYSTEFSREILGQNKIAQFSLKKEINYLFSEHEFILERTTKGQSKTFKDLQRLHLERRQQIRMTYEYHREEMRKEILKLKNDDKFLREQLELEQAIRQKKMSINELVEEQRNLMKETSEKLGMKKNGKRNKPTDKEVILIEDKISDINLQDTVEASDNQEQIMTVNLSRSRSFLQTKALEVTKDLLQPRTVERSSFDRPIAKTDRPVENKRQSEDLLKPLAYSEIKFNESPCNINEREIYETLKATNDTLKLPERINKRRKPKSLKNVMKENKIKKEREIKDVLMLPYVAYRRNSSGKIVALDHPPVTKVFNEPSNKEKYTMKKVLDEERRRYLASMINLTNTTEYMIQEEIRKRNQIYKPSEEVKGEPKLEDRNIGILSWMNVFVSSNMPDDIDPMSPEAIIYCRYIRAPLETYSHLPNYLIYHTPL